MADIVARSEQPQTEYTFNPNQHLMQIKSRAGASDYLPVQWRLVWFRSLCPDGTIETEIVHLDVDRETEEEVYQWNNETRRSEKVVKRAPGFAVVRAIVKDGRGGMATGTKSEKAASFPDFLEKAETGAIGRALAALGYGTQFTGEEFDERHRIVDAPVDRDTEAASAAPIESNGASPATVNRTISRGQGEQSASRTQTAPERIPSWQDIYKAGKAKGLWVAANGFCAFASAELGQNVSEESVKTLRSDMLKQLASAVESEKPVAQSA